ncbi:MAG: CBS domain-containing protein [Deltaproteobacteria bacterium]|nr:CBS domain-containing protein [Kofleriaceae bacterium]
MTRIAHLMTPEPVTIRVDTTVAEASQIMATCGLRHLPVVDAGNHLIGMISDRDLRGPLVGRDGAGPVASDEVRGYMTRDLITAEPEEELGAVARRIVDRRIGAVPVVDPKGELRGIVSYVDVLRRLADDADADARALELMEAI